MLAGAFDCGWVPHARAGDRYGARSGTETAVGPDSLLSEVSGFADEATMQGGGFRLVAKPADTSTAAASVYDRQRTPRAC